MIILINSFYISCMRAHTYSLLIPLFFIIIITGPLAKRLVPIVPKIFRAIPEFFVLYCRSVSNYSPPSKPIEFLPLPLMVFSLENRFDSGGGGGSVSVIHHKKSSGSVRGGFQEDEGVCLHCSFNN